MRLERGLGSLLITTVLGSIVGAGTYPGVRWSSRLVATPSENRLSFHRKGGNRSAAAKFFSGSRGAGAKVNGI